MDKADILPHRFMNWEIDGGPKRSAVPRFNHLVEAPGHLDREKGRFQIFPIMDGFRVAMSRDSRGNLRITVEARCPLPYRAFRVEPHMLQSENTREIRKFFEHLPNAEILGTFLPARSDSPYPDYMHDTFLVEDIFDTEESRFVDYDMWETDIMQRRIGHVGRSQDYYDYDAEWLQKLARAPRYSAVIEGREAPGIVVKDYYWRHIDGSQPWTLFRNPSYTSYLPDAPLQTTNR